MDYIITQTKHSIKDPFTRFSKLKDLCILLIKNQLSCFIPPSSDSERFQCPVKKGIITLLSRVPTSVSLSSSADEDTKSFSMQEARPEHSSH